MEFQPMEEHFVYRRISLPPAEDRKSESLQEKGEKERQSQGWENLCFGRYCIYTGKTTLHLIEGYLTGQRYVDQILNPHVATLHPDI